MGINLGKAHTVAVVSQDYAGEELTRVLFLIVAKLNGNPRGVGVIGILHEFSQRDVITCHQALAKLTHQLAVDGKP